MRYITFAPSSFSNSFTMTIFIGLTFLLLSSCARIPEPIGYQYSEQQKMQAAQHWQILAADVANRINNQLIINDYLHTPLYVKATCGDEDKPCLPQETSTFDEAFRDLLITDLVNFGVPVRQQADEDTITVHYKVQVVYHKSRRIRTIRPGLITSIATGIMVMRNAPHEFKTIATAGLVDFANAAADVKGEHEIIITTSLVDKSRYLFRESDIYYINDKDYSQYHSIRKQATEISLIAPSVPAKRDPVSGVNLGPSEKNDNPPENGKTSSDI